MAKKKNSEPIEQEVVIVEDTPVETEEIEEIIEEEIETVEEVSVVPSDTFLERSLKAINKMENHAKAKRLANRLIRKKARNQ